MHPRIRMEVGNQKSITYYYLVKFIYDSLKHFFIGLNYFEYSKEDLKSVQFRLLLIRSLSNFVAASFQSWLPLFVFDQVILIVNLQPGEWEMLEILCYEFLFDVLVCE